MYSIVTGLTPTMFSIFTGLTPTMYNIVTGLTMYSIVGVLKINDVLKLFSTLLCVCGHLKYYLSSKSYLLQFVRYHDQPNLNTISVNLTINILMFTLS